jgi:TolB-like protein
VPGRGYRFIGQVAEAHRDPHLRIAILPVENATGNPENDYLADGITEQLIECLGKSSSGEFQVTALASVLRYKRLALPLNRIAQDLGVDRLVAGRLRHIEDGLRLRLELIEPQDQFGFWVNSFTLADASDLSICEQAAKEIGSSLRLKTGYTHGAPRIASGEHAKEAHSAYLRGRYFWNQRTQQAVARAIEYFQWAADRDPSCVAAYIGLAECYVALTSWGVLHPREALSLARENASKALSIDPHNSEAYVAIAWAQLAVDQNWPGAEQSFRTAISLNPSNAVAYHW